MGEALALEDEALVERHRDRGFNTREAFERRRIATPFLCHSLARGGEELDCIAVDRRGERAGAPDLPAFGRHLLGICNGAGPQIAGDQFIDDAEFERALAADGLAADDHVERRRDADQARQPLRATGAGQDAELHFGQCDLGTRRAAAVVRG